MDQVMIDLSALPEVGPGEEVTVALIGEDGGELILAGDGVDGRVGWQVQEPCARPLDQRLDARDWRRNQSRARSRGRFSRV